MKYRENLPPALKSVTFDVLPKEKIGIVGRSGSGMFIVYHIEANLNILA